MLTAICLSLGFLFGAHSGVHPASTCHDLDTQSCIGFKAAKPDLCDDPTFSQSMCKQFCGNCPLECYSCPDPVQHPGDCMNTTTCGPSMQCVNRHLRAKDGHHEYLLACESKELCSLLAGGFGKRSLDDIDDLGEVARDRYERDVILNCCDTDLCNVQLLTTLPTTTTSRLTPATPRPVTTSPRPTTTTQRLTTTPTTTTTTRATTTVSPECNKDVVFIMQNYMDSSHSLLGLHTGSASRWVPFVEQVVSQINVGSRTTNVALATFDSRTRIKLDFSHQSTLSDVTYTVTHALTSLQHDRLHALSPSTNLQDMLHQMNYHVFQERKGDRADVQNVVVLLENGALSSPDTHGNIHSELPTFHNTTDKVIIISVGAAPDARHQVLATDGNHMLQVSDYKQLYNIAAQIANLICA